MNTATSSDSSPILDRLAEAEKWLDNRGKGAWIVLIVLGFIIFWPLGLALLLWVVWGRSRYARDEIQDPPQHNSPFEAHRAETLESLEQEQARFGAFVDRLRASGDRAEFDTFLDERAGRATRAETAPGYPESAQND